MKRAVLLLVLLVAAPAQAQELRTGFVSTGVVGCTFRNPGVGWGHWSNTTPYDLYLRKLRIWIGASYGAVIDTGATVTINGGPQVGVVEHAQDRYSSPSGSDDAWFDFTPDYFIVKPGQWVSIRTGCTVVEHWCPGPQCGQPIGDPRAGVETNAVLYYTMELPGAWTLWHLFDGFKVILTELFK